MLLGEGKEEGHILAVTSLITAVTFPNASPTATCAVALAASSTVAKAPPTKERVCMLAP